MKCGQEYEGFTMRIAPCVRARCPNWERNRCGVHMGVEHLPTVPPDQVPDCPLRASCQHQAQSGPSPCPVRARGLVCESALRIAGVPESELSDHPLAFNAYLMR